MTPEEYCQEKTAKSGSSFYYSFLFLPRQKRQAITALYAFCREVDDVADADTEVSIKQVKLQWWRDEIDRLFTHQPQHPVSKALLPHITAFNLPREYFLEIIDGMEMDLHQDRYQSFNDLRLYCHRVAGVVGLLSAEIFGFKNRNTLRYAEALGLAFQLTNIIRDVGEDAMRNRIYLPLDELKQFGVTEEDILHHRHSDAFSRLMQFQAKRAQQTYQQAFSLLPDEDRYSQNIGIIMAAIYRTTLQEVEKDGLRVLTHRVVMSPLRKMWIALSTLFSEWFRHRLPQRGTQG